MWTMTYLRYRRCFRRSDIEDDGRRNVDTCEERISEAFGRPRPFDPVGDHEHGRLAEDFSTDAVIEERKADLEEQQKKVTFLSRPWVLLVGFAIVYCVEVLGCIRVVATLGEENPERTIFGVGLAFCLFGLTYALMKASNPRSEVTV